MTDCGWEPAVSVVAMCLMSEIKCHDEQVILIHCKAQLLNWGQLQPGQTAVAVQSWIYLHQGKCIFCSMLIFYMIFFQPDNM